MRQASDSPVAVDAPALYIVAHADDTLLFQSPSILQHIAGNRRVRTVFLSAGDNGEDASYWTARERGAKNAYALMAGVTPKWSSAAVEADGHSLLLLTLDGRPNVSLVFMRLPDGGYPDGNGTAAYGYQSLKRLWQGKIPAIDAVDGSTAYTRQGLVETLAALMIDYEPGWIATQDYVDTYGDGDHADHYTTAYAVRLAEEMYATPHALVGFTGYNTQHLPANVCGELLLAKQQAFYTYGREDHLTCTDDESCSARPEGAWLRRQYQLGPASPRWARMLRRIRRRVAATISVRRAISRVGLGRRRRRRDAPSSAARQTPR